MKWVKLTVVRSGICPICGLNWIGLVGSCNCGYSGPLINDEFL